MGMCDIVCRATRERHVVGAPWRHAASRLATCQCNIPIEDVLRRLQTFLWHFKAPLNGDAASRLLWTGVHLSDLVRHERT